MATHYEKLVQENLRRLYDGVPESLEKALPGKREKEVFHFRAFGEPCSLAPEGIMLSGKPCTDPRGLLITLYALHAKPEPIHLEPFTSFREFPGSMPYQGAFAANTERVLIPHVSGIGEKRDAISQSLDGLGGAREEGDFAFVLLPLPKIALLYIFYHPDDDFPASATCLFSSNALTFMPLDGLADVAEYTSKAMIRLIGFSCPRTLPL